jgi:serine/threonine protein kinase
VKPANIVLDHDELPHLTDFGIAVLSGAPRLTDPNTLVGTPAYLAPEQLHGKEAGPPADVYALSLVLLECLTGEVEYPADNTLASALARLSRPPRIPPGLPGELADLLAAMTATEPTARPSAEECARRLLSSADEPSPAELTAIAAEPPAWWADEDRTVVAPAGSPRPITGSTRRDWRSLTAASVGVAAVAAAVVFLLNLQPSPPGGVPSGSPAEHTTSQPATSGGGNRDGSGGRAGSGPLAGTLVANERPALTVVTTPSQATRSIPPSTTTPSTTTPSTSAPTSPSPSSTTEGPTTTSSSQPITTSSAPGNGTGVPNP